MAGAVEHQVLNTEQIEKIKYARNMRQARDSFGVNSLGGDSIFLRRPPLAPEPSSVILFSVALTGMTFFFVRRRRNVNALLAAAEEQAEPSEEPSDERAEDDPTQQSC